MGFPKQLRCLVRIIIGAYCRVVPLPAGKTQLMFHTQFMTAPHKEVVALKSGGRFNVDLSDNIQRQIFFLREYEPEITRLILRTLISDDTFIDIGANTGYYTVMAGHIVGPNGRVHSFEPIPRIFRDLEANISLNRLSNVSLNRTAILDSNGEIEIFLPTPGNLGSGSAMWQIQHTEGSVRCITTTLDDYIEHNEVGQIRLIKIDIEGTEFSALLGMRGVLSETHPPEIICEIVPQLLESAPNTSDDLYAFLGSFGYRGRHIDRWNVHFVKEL